ncbi:GGDEF domain-containing protein [Ferribacterium limneticum]|uniref:GGDEF domain-containing protein n=1 Tax=Ferribacterium limneticum TaxID=76259 RepID=UPI001CF92242|nr:GGDEF domain-containing protein [Ferribacterium limneticum]UCV23417.1 GGDEF domain-containing protein [Ferribacterium limneticum]
MITALKAIRAGRAFALLAALFLVAFGIAVVQLSLDQQRVVDATSRLQEQTVPEIIRFQRLARNLEQLRQEGERIFAVSSHTSRQQSMFVVTLIASHPSILEHPGAAQLARETEQFLGDVVRQAATADRRPATRYDEWQRIAARLGMQVDDVSVQGINLANNDLAVATSAMKLARYKLMIALLLVGIFLLVFMVLVRRHLIYPLQRINHALSTLSADRPAPAFKPSTMLEIQAVEESISEHHALLIQNEETRQALEKLANKDGLTGIMNRRHFMQSAEVELQRAQRYRRPVTVAMADLDLFKKLNDTYGHAAGDAVLCAFANLVEDTLRQSDLVCRYGGEEFAFLFPEIGAAETEKLAERLRVRCAAMEVPLPDGRSVKATVSIGLADASECPIEIALKRADEALYEAKRLGRNRVVVSGPPEPAVDSEPDTRTASLF